MWLFEKFRALNARHYINVLFMLTNILHKNDHNFVNSNATDLSQYSKDSP